MMPILSLELPSDSLRLRQSIGNGEFGRVHIGDAQGVNGTEDWTTVAIKTLAGLPPLIKLMIQCFSAYTTKRPFTKYVMLGVLQALPRAGMNLFFAQTAVNTFRVHYIAGRIAAVFQSHKIIYICQPKSVQRHDARRTL